EPGRRRPGLRLRELLHQDRAPGAGARLARSRNPLPRRPRGGHDRTTHLHRWHRDEGVQVHLRERARPGRRRGSVHVSGPAVRRRPGEGDLARALEGRRPPASELTRMLLDVRDVTISFGGLSALDRVSLGVAQGEILGLIGPNGAGKTTLLDVVAGVRRPKAGTIRFLGRDVTGRAPDALCRLGIARTLQIARGFPRLSALDNVRVAALFGGRGNRAAARGAGGW